MLITQLLEVRPGTYLDGFACEILIDVWLEPILGVVVGNNHSGWTSAFRTRRGRLRFLRRAKVLEGVIALKTAYIIKWHYSLPPPASFSTGMGLSGVRPPPRLPFMPGPPG